MEKLLEDAQIKVSVVVSDIFGVSGRDMLAALVAGERNPTVLAQLARRTHAQEDHRAGGGAHRLLHRSSCVLAGQDARPSGCDHRRYRRPGRADRRSRSPRSPQRCASWIEVDRDQPGRRARHPRRDRPGHDPLPHRRSPGVLGEIRTRGAANRRARRKARTPPATATPTWPRSWATPPRPPAGPAPSPASATGGSPAAAAPKKPTSPSAGPSWSSSGTCYPIPRPATPTSAPGSTPPAPTPTAAAATTSASSKHSATPSSSNAPPNPRAIPPAPPRSAGAAARPVTARFSDQLVMRVRFPSPAPSTNRRSAACIYRLTVVRSCLSTCRAISLRGLVPPARSVEA